MYPTANIIRTIIMSFFIASIPFCWVSIMTALYQPKQALKNYCARSSCVEIRLKMLINTL